MQQVLDSLCQKQADSLLIVSKSFAYLSWRRLAPPGPYSIASCESEVVWSGPSRSFRRV